MPAGSFADGVYRPGSHVAGSLYTAGSRSIPLRHSPSRPSQHASESGEDACAPDVGKECRALLENVSFVEYVLGEDVRHACPPHIAMDIRLMVRI